MPQYLLKLTKTIAEKEEMGNMDEINLNEMRENVEIFVEEAAEKASEAAERIEQAANDYVEQASGMAEELGETVQAKVDEIAGERDKEGASECTAGFEAVAGQLEEGARGVAEKIGAGLKEHGVDTGVMAAKLSEDAASLKGMLSGLAETGANAAADALESAAAALRPKKAAGEADAPECDEVPEELGE